MPIQKVLRQTLRETETDIMIIENFPLEMVIEFIFEHEIANHRAPITPAIQVIITDSTPDFAALRTAVLGKNVDLSQRGAKVVIFNEMRGGFMVRLDDVKMAIKTAAPHNKAVLVATKLDKISDFYDYTQAQLLTTMQEMLIAATANPDLVTTLPLISSLVDDVENPMRAKIAQFLSVKTDREKLVELIDNAQASLIGNYGAYLNIYKRKLERVPEYFPINVLHRNVHAEDFVYKNQDLVEKPISPIINLSKFTVTKNTWIKAVNSGSEPIKLWRSKTISTKVPEDASTLEGNSTGMFYGGDLGVDDATYFMLGFTGDLDMVKAMFTKRRTN